MSAPLNRKYPLYRYAPGWGPAVVKDARFKGWEPLKLGGPIGSKVTVLSVEERILGAGHALESGLYVLARVTWPDGSSWLMDDILRRPSKAEVSEMRELADYLNRIIGDRDLAELKDRLELLAFDELPNMQQGKADRAPVEVLRFADGPRLSPVDFLQCLDAVEPWQGLVEGGEANEEIAVSRGLIDDAIESAFRAGFVIAQAGVQSQLQRTKALKAARKRAVELKGWWPDGAKWAQALVDAWPSGETLNVAALARKMLDEWSKGPLVGAVVRRTQRQLETKILPVWRSSGELKFPEDAGEP